MKPVCVLLLTCLFYSPAFAGRKWYQQKKEYTPEGFGVAGLAASPGLDNTFFGGEATIGGTLFRNFLIDGGLGQMQFSTSNPFGYPWPNTSKYHVTTSYIGLGMAYKIVGGSRFRMIAGCNEYFDYVSLGNNQRWYTREYYPYLSYYRTLATDGYVYIRPFVAVLTNNMGLEMGYNIPQDGSFSFGSLHDLSSFQATLNVSWQKKNGQTAWLFGGHCRGDWHYY